MKQRVILIVLLYLVTCSWAPVAVVGQEGLVQVHQDFSTDPGWESMNNRIVAEDPPTIKQDFGFSPTDHSGGSAATPAKSAGRSGFPARPPTTRCRSIVP